MWSFYIASILLTMELITALSPMVRFYYVGIYWFSLALNGGAASLVSSSVAIRVPILQPRRIALQLFDEMSYRGDSNLERQMRFLKLHNRDLRVGKISQTGESRFRYHILAKAVPSTHQPLWLLVGAVRRALNVLEGEFSTEQLTKDITLRFRNESDRDCSSSISPFLSTLC